MIPRFTFSFNRETHDVDIQPVNSMSYLAFRIVAERLKATVDSAHYRMPMDEQTLHILRGKASIIATDAINGRDIIQCRFCGMWMRQDEVLQQQRPA